MAWQWRLLPSSIMIIIGHDRAPWQALELLGLLKMASYNRLCSRIGTIFCASIDDPMNRKHAPLFIGLLGSDKLANRGEQSGLRVLMRPMTSGQRQLNVRELVYLTQFALWCFPTVMMFIRLKAFIRVWPRPLVWLRLRAINRPFGLFEWHYYEHNSGNES